MKHPIRDEVHDAVGYADLTYDELDHDALKLAALAHLERWAAPPRHLQRVLMRKVDRALEDDPRRARRRPACAAIVARVVAELVHDGIASEADFARARTLRLRLAGNSSAKVRAKLAAKGVSREEIDRTLDFGDSTGPDPEWLAACRYARRRGLGPYRPDAAARAERRARDLAAMGRAGFPYELAVRAIDACSPDDLDAAPSAIDPPTPDDCEAAPRASDTD